MSMTTVSCSLPQMLKVGVHAEMNPSAIAEPLRNALPGCATTETRTVWFWFVHPTWV